MVVSKMGLCAAFGKSPCGHRWTSLEIWECCRRYLQNGRKRCGL